MNIAALRQNALRVSSTLINTFRQSSSKTPDIKDISWSVGEKQKPLPWRHEPDKWYRIDKHLLYPHPLDPKDPKQIYPYKREDGGIQYHNFVYYPKHPDEVDEKFEVTPLLLIWRVKRLKHTTWWEKRIMKELGIDLFGSAAATVVKNIPEMNARLWQVKHLIKILPLRFPKDAPKDDNPLNYFIQENGEVIYKPVVNVTETDLEPVETEKTADNEWIKKQTEKIYHNSLKLEF